MNITKLLSDESKVEKELQFFLRKGQIRKISKNKELVKSHLQKARHNFAFYRLNAMQTRFNDWLIVTLYYSLYHCALALITNKDFISKNHFATILILIKEYKITKNEAELIDELSVSKEDAELYTNLKDERHNASYVTDLQFTDEKIQFYEEKVLDFINKTEDLMN